LTGLFRPQKLINRRNESEAKRCEPHRTGCGALQQNPSISDEHKCKKPMTDSQWDGWIDRRPQTDFAESFKKSESQNGSQLASVSSRVASGRALEKIEQFVLQTEEVSRCQYKDCADKYNQN